MDSKFVLSIFFCENFVKSDEEVVMALPVDFVRAKVALLYNPPSFETGEKTENPEKKFENKSDNQVDILKVIEDIIVAQEKLNQLTTRSERQKLQDEWSNPLGSDLVQALNRLVKGFLILTCVSKPLMY